MKVRTLLMVLAFALLLAAVPRGASAAPPSTIQVPAYATFDMSIAGYASNFTVVVRMPGNVSEVLLGIIFQYTNYVYDVWVNNAKVFSGLKLTWTDNMRFVRVKGANELAIRIIPWNGTHYYPFEITMMAVISSVPVQVSNVSMNFYNATMTVTVPPLFTIPAMVNVEDRKVYYLYGAIVLPNKVLSAYSSAGAIVAGINSYYNCSEAYSDRRDRTGGVAFSYANLNIPTLTLTVTVSMADYPGITMNVAGYALPAGAKGFLSDAVSFAAPLGGELTPYFNGSSGLGGYGTYRVGAYGWLQLSNGSVLFVRRDFGYLKYYGLNLVERVAPAGCDGCWDLDKVAWGNRTLYLRVNGTSYAFPPDWTAGKVALVPWFGVAGSPFTGPGAVSVVVNDTAKTVVVNWGNKAGKLTAAHGVLYYDNATTGSLTQSPNTAKVLMASAGGFALLVTDAPIVKLTVTSGLANQVAGNAVALYAGSATVYLRTTLTVTVQTADGKPVEGAQVRVLDSTGMLVASRATDSSGKAVFVLTPGSSYTVEVTSGSEVQTQFVALTDDATVSFTVTQVPPKPLLTTETVMLIMLVLAVVAVAAVLAVVVSMLRRGGGRVFVIE